MGRFSSRWRRFLCVSWLFLAAALPLPSPAEEIAVEERGSLILPNELHDADGRPVPIVGLSGITWMGDDRYLGVMDNSRTLLGFRLELSDVGRPLSASDMTIRLVAERHDYEDVVWMPGPSGAGQERATGRVLLCDEDSPGIRIFELSSGRRVESLPVPEIFRSRRPNRGFESLAIDAGGRYVWTANEEPLAVDGPPVTADAAGVVRIVRVPIDRPAPGGGPSVLQHAYPLDPPHRFVKLLEGPVFSGVTAIVCPGPGRLLMLERSGGPGLPPFESRIYDVSLEAAEDVSGVRERLAEKSSAHLAKRLVWRGQLGINLEGLCLGPRIASGCRTLVGIGDNGGLGTPSRLVVFELKAATPTSPSPCSTR